MVPNKWSFWDISYTATRWSIRMLVLEKYSNGFGSSLSAKWPQNKESTSASSSLQDSSFMGEKRKKEKKKKHGSTTEQEMKNSFITEMMWEILYVGNMQFPKIEAGQNHFNYLGINIVAFFLTQSGQQRLFKAAEDKCQTDLVPAVKSVLPVMPQRQRNWHRTTKGYLKIYFFQITRKLKSMSSQVFSVLLEQFDYLNYVEFFSWIFQISVATWYISCTPFSSFKTILFIMLTVSTWTQMLYMKQRSYGSDQPSLSIFNLMWTEFI